MNIRTNPRVVELQEKIDEIPACIKGTYYCEDCEYIRECTTNQQDREVLFKRLAELERKLQDRRRGE